MDPELILLAKEAGVAGAITLLVMGGLFKFLKPLRDALVAKLTKETADGND